MGNFIFFWRLDGPANHIIQSVSKSVSHPHFFNIIDNISIKESSLNGCIPILSQLSELSGIHLPGNPDDVNDMIQAAETLVTMIKNDEKIKEIRQKIVSNKQLYSWEDTANQWMEHLQLKSIHSILSK